MKNAIGVINPTQWLLIDLGVLRTVKQNIGKNMNNNEMNLTVENGYPIQDFDQGRDGEELDLQHVNALWYERGLRLAGDEAAQFTQLYYNSISHGSHPELAYQVALDALGIQWQFDTFLITEKNETIEI